MDIRVSMSSATDRQLLEFLMRSSARIETQLLRMELIMTDLDMAVADVQAAVDGVAQRTLPLIMDLKTQLETATASLASADATITAQNQAAVDALAAASANADKLEVEVGRLNAIGADPTTPVDPAPVDPIEPPVVVDPAPVDPNVPVDPAPVDPNVPVDPNAPVA